MISPGDVVAIERNDEIIHGQVVLAIWGDTVWLVIDRAGRLLSAYYAALHKPGEGDGWGHILFTEDPEDLKRATDALLKEKGIQKTIRIIRRYARLSPPTEEKGVIDIWNIPLKLVVGYSSDLAPHFISYLEASPMRKQRIERALDLLETRAPKQYKVLLACYYGETPQSWVAKAWGIKRQSVNELLAKGIQFLENWGLNSDEGA